MIVDSALAPVRMIANDATELCQGSFTYSIFVSLLLGLIFGLDSSAVAIGKKERLKKYPPLTSHIKTLRQESTARTFRRAMVLLAAVQR